jgi:hypothetical protein
VSLIETRLLSLIKTIPTVSPNETVSTEYTVLSVIDNQDTSRLLDDSLVNKQQQRETDLTSFAIATNKSILIGYRSTLRVETDLAPFGNDDIAREIPQMTAKQKVVQ